VPSKSLERWQTQRLANLTEFERQVLSLPLAPSLMDECLGAFAMVLSSHLQGFSRELYSECVSRVVAHAPPYLGSILLSQSTTKIELNSGNPTFAAINNDFLRFGVSIKDELKTTNGNPDIGMHIERLQKWRNYCAHNNPNKPSKAGPFNRTEVMKWMASCNDLAEAMDAVMARLFASLGIPAW
jgi:hypothetical protein